MWYTKHFRAFVRRNKNKKNPIREIFRLCTAPRTRPNSPRSRPKGVPGAFRTLPGRFRDGPGAVSGLPRTVPRRLFRAPGPFRSLPGRFRMILDRFKLPQNDFSSILRRIWDIFSSIWARFGFDFRRDLVRRPARLSFRFSGFAGPPRYAGRSRFNDLLPAISICAAVSGNACGSLLDRRQVAKCSCPVHLRHPFVAGQHRH